MEWKHYLVLGILVALIGGGMYTLLKEKYALTKEKNELTASLTELKKENDSVKDSIEYYTHPENLLKELKSQFNYREVGEELIILVPKTTSTATSTR